MKHNTFLTLLAVAAILIAASFLRFGNEKQTGDRAMGDKLFADLPVNAVVKMTIADPKNQTTLTKGKTVWQVEERSGYPADFNELGNLVLKISRLKIGRSFSGSEESLHRLSLTPPSANDPDGKSKQITLADASGKVLADVILGKIREAEGGGGGQYLKLANSDDVFLVDNSFRFLKTEPTQWLKKEIVDIDAEKIRSVVCYKVDDPNPVYTLSRPKKGESAQLTPIPSDRKADSAKIDQVFDAIGPLSLNDVTPVDQASTEGDPEGFRLVYRLYDGRKITIRPDFDGKEHYTIRMAAREIPEEEMEELSEEESKTDTEDKETASGGDEDKTEVIPANELNEQLSPWVFSIQKWQFNSLMTQVESLLEPLPEKKADDAS